MVAREVVANWIATGDKAPPFSNGRAGAPRRRRARAARAATRPKRRDDVAIYADNGRQSAGRQSIRDSRGGCSLAGWKFQNQGGAEWSAVPDPIGGAESGNCVAQLTNAASSKFVQPPVGSLSLSPGFYSIRCNTAAKDNNSAQISIQYVPAGNCTPPKGVNWFWNQPK